jgi:hypothetical protein
MSTDLYETLGVQNDATDEESTSNPSTSVILTLSNLLTQSEELTRNGRYKPTQIVSPRNIKQLQRMSLERFLQLLRSPSTIRSLTTPGQQRI